MWDEGIKVFDAYRQELLTLRATLLWTINNFIAYGNLSGYSVKGIRHVLFVKKTHFSLIKA